MRFSSIRSRWHWLLVLGLPLLAFAPYYGEGLSTHGDNLLHLYRLVALHKNVLEGNFYPRWTSELFLGFGYPLLNFYASATYYVAEGLHLLGAGYENALIYAMVGLLICASIGIYRLALDIFGDLFSDWGVVPQAPALVATAAYIFAPYLLFNFYVRGAIAELGAQALFPWIFWSFRRLLRSEEPTRYLIWSILSLAALAFTHTVSLMLTPPVLVVYALVLLWPYRRERKELWRRLSWFAVATASAAAVSAFFWLPALVERQFLTRQAQEASALYLDQHVWTWQNFLDLNWVVIYNDGLAPHLRMVQVILAVAGLLTGFRRKGEWIFMAGLALVSCLLVGEYTMPLWRSHPLLLTIQFPWRLLGIAALPMALLTGGLVTRGWHTQRSRRRYSAAGAAILIGVIVFVNYPRMDWLTQLEIEPEQVNLTSISQYEAITNRYGLSAATFREFTPRWVKELELKSVPSGTEDAPLDITLDHAGPQKLQMSVAASRPSRLLFATLFFPGWHAELEDGQRLEPYPVSDFGLLAVDLPAGEHHLSVSWAETSVQRWGEAISLLALLALSIVCLSRPSLRRWVIYPVAPLLVVTLLLVLSPWRAPSYYPTPDQPLTEGIQLLGYTTYQETADEIYLFPHWYVEEVPTDLILHWQLLDANGKVVAAMHSFPYFDTLRAFQWSANMVVDDGYYFPLPPGLAAGEYTLALAVTPANAEVGEGAMAARTVGKIQVAQDVAPLPEFANPLEVYFKDPDEDNQVTLRAYTVAGESAPDTKGDGKGEQGAAGQLTVAPGDTVTYTLYWQSQEAIPVGVQVFYQLLDHNRTTLTQVNQPLALSRGSPYYLWNPYWLKEQRYRLQIPEDAAGGLYQPYVGIYHVETENRFSATGADGAEIGDAVFLPPFKVARRTATPLAHPLLAQFGDAIQLESYEVEYPAGELQPQSTLTLTLQYKSLAPVTIDYTQFIHLSNPELGMAAQVDTPPQGNGNPTSTWVPGEVIVDTIPLRIVEGVKPGRYTLSMGLYDPMSGARLPVLDQAKQPQPDNRLLLEEIEIK